MADAVASAALDVIHPSGERTRIPIQPLPFRIGRGPDNDLILRDNRASRAHASISRDGAGLAIEDLGSLHGTWVNGKRIDKPTTLENGDAVHFGFEDSYRLTFSDSGGRISRILNQISSALAPSPGAADRLARLRALVELARTLQSSLAADEVLAAVIEAALSLTGAERGFLLLRSDDDLEIKVGRNADGAKLTRDDLQMPTSLIHRALNDRRDMLAMELSTQASESGDSQPAIDFPNVICVPLVQFRSISSEKTITISSDSNTVGLLYLDSREKRSPLSELNRELLHTLALEASTVLENAKLLEEEREKRLLEQELQFAQKMQQNLLPREFPDSGWFAAAGSSLPAAGVAGDYFDVHAIGNETWSAVLADVSGKGISSALLASLLQGAFLLGSELSAPLDALLEKINHFLVQRAQFEKYATLFYARIQQNGEAEWVNAGQCLPFLVRADGAAQRLESTGAPLGLLPNAQFEVQHLQLAPGDKIIIYSDGMPEAQNGRKEMYEDRLDASLQALQGLNAQQIHDKLIREVEQFREGEPLRDDVTLLVLEYRGQSEQLAQDARGG